MLRRFLPALRGSRVLNAGCGAGSMTLTLLDRGIDVTSIDASEAFVGRLRAELARRESAAAVDIGDLEAMPYPDESFDGLVCGEVLEHLDDDRAAVREFHRVLKPGGTVLASVPANPARFDWMDEWAGHRRRYTVEELDDVFRDAGFAEVAVTPWGFPLTGVFHRHVVGPMLRRRLERGAPPPNGQHGMARVVSPLVRRALELDTLFLGKRPGYFGLLAQATRPR